MSEELDDIEHEESSFTEADLEAMWIEVCEGFKAFDKAVKQKMKQVAKGEKISKEEWESHREFRKLVEEKEKFYVKMFKMLKAKGQVKNKPGEQGKMVDMSVVKDKPSSLGSIEVSTRITSNG